MNTHFVPLVGAHFRPPAKAILQSLPANHPLYLQPEPTNPYDPNAVAVWIDAAIIPDDAIEELKYTLPGMGSDIEALINQRHWHLGYMAKEHASKHQQEIGYQISAHNEEVDRTGEGVHWEGFPCYLSFGGDGKPLVKFNI